MNKIFPKVISKVYPKVEFGILRKGGFLGGGLTVPVADLIAWYKGTTSDDGTDLYATSGRHSDQVKGTSVLGDGTGIGTITGLLTSATFTVGTGSGSPTCTVAGRLDIATGVNVWDLKIYHAGVLFADLAMICKDSTTEYSATDGLPDCVWSGFVSDPIVSHTDGTGSSRANEDGYGTNASGHHVPYYHSTATATYPGPIAADGSFVNMGCLLGDSVPGYIAITGLLTTDTITAGSTDKPTCTVNGQLAIADGDKVHDVYITRAGTVWAHYPCENGHPTHNSLITMVEDVVGGNHGVATSFTGTCWGERDTGDFALAKGFSVDRTELGVGSGYSAVDPLTLLHQDSTSPTYLKNAWDTALALPASFKGALGPETQALTSFTGEAELTRLVGQSWNVDDKEFTGTLGAALYSAAQGAASQAVLNIRLGRPDTYVTAKSVILDITDNYGGGYSAIRSVDFLLDDSIITMTSGFSAYATTTVDASHGPEKAFDTSLSKIGTQTGFVWHSSPALAGYNNRLIIVFDTPLKFNEIVVNNNHHNGGLTARGAKNVTINISSDEVTSTVFEAAIPNATLLFDGVFTEHPPTNTEDNQTYHPSE